VQSFGSVRLRLQSTEGALLYANREGRSDRVRNQMAIRIAGSKDGPKVRLARYRQIKISVIGRKSGQTISIPVWFVLEGEKLYLLPVSGSEVPERPPEPVDSD
jgi:hypothetical protein